MFVPIQCTVITQNVKEYIHVYLTLWFNLHKIYMTYGTLFNFFQSNTNYHIKCNLWQVYQYIYEKKIKIKTSDLFKTFSRQYEIKKMEVMFI